MQRLPYGYTVDQNDRIIIHQAEAEIVKMIFQSYLAGDSLGKIADQLSEKKMPSPTGKDGWSRAAIDKLLSNGKCVPHIISMEEFLKVQIEKANRSSINYDKGKRKATRYNSQNVLSGLLVAPNAVPIIAGFLWPPAGWSGDAPTGWSRCGAFWWKARLKAC